MYKIQPYSYAIAKTLGVEIKPSTRKNKKIDVFRNGTYITSIGDTRYFDYPTYIETKGLQYANKRRELYKKRHEADRSIVGSAGWFADKILW